MVKVVFIHPDLGIGGAERAVIDAALALKARGHEPQFVTAHHDPGHCFQEMSDGTFQVTVAGDWLPRSILGKCFALCAYLRMIYAAVYLVFFSSFQYDLIFCDQISACIPVLKLSKAKILFYCHFPDMLLTKRQTRLKALYRWPIDKLEEWTTGMADTILVNSNFTAGVFRDTFTSLGHIQPEVLYPIPDFTNFNLPVDDPDEFLIPKSAKTTFLSINRYERKKNLNLAIEAFGCLKEMVKNFEEVHLIMAGGYDERVVENKEHFEELSELAISLNLSEQMTFMRSFSDAQKRTLLKHSDCLLYTPSNEHFGIVPIEAMYMKCPVVAVNSGGPLETVDDGTTGFLCPPTPNDFANAMKQFIINPSKTKSMGKAGHDRVTELFSFDAFTDKLENIVLNMLDTKKKDD